MADPVPIRGFVPVLTTRFPLDTLLLPYVERFSPAALYSAPELLSPAPALPRLPLMVDSGGYAALRTDARIEERGGLGVLVTPDYTLDVETVRRIQADHAAHTSFTLDFPAPAETPAAERDRRARLSYANARAALAGPRAGLLYACVQSPQEVSALLALKPDGLALGGLAPYSADRPRLVDAVSAVRCQMPAELPLHVFGLGHPESVRAALDAGATSVDSSACQRTAAAGKSWTGETLVDPSPPERLRLALSNLLTLTQAPVPLSWHPAWRS